MNSKTNIPILTFKNSNQWASWLEKNFQTDGVWLKFYKKNSGIVSLKYSEALEEALCYGWIDSQVKSLDKKSYLQKFTPRRSKSIWSKINTEHIKRLIKQGRMKPSGMEQVEQAKKDGRWDAAYDSPNSMEIPPDFLNQLTKNKKAASFFKTLNKTNTYAIAWRLQTAKKPETRQKRLKQIIEMLTREEKIY